MNNSGIYDVVIVGGGLAGLVTAIELSSHRLSVLLLEKNQYPFHKVCGEYVSNEVLGYVKSLGFNPHKLGASTINTLRVSTPQGKNYTIPLDMGGFGISRHTMDNVLYQLAIDNGADIVTGTKVTNIQIKDNLFITETRDSTYYTSKLAIAGHGKRDVLDKRLNRDFIKHHTGYMGVKYHLKTDYPSNEIGLDNFRNGYCGIVRIENNRYNLCYLYKKEAAYHFKNIPELEENVLYKNPVLKSIFRNADFLFQKPEVINEICFDKKEPVKHHIFMCGDSAGLITPLCGNGMAMAITAAKMLSDLLIRSGICNQKQITMPQREQIENIYTSEWNKLFSKRLFWGRTIQQYFGNPLYTGLFIKAAYHSPFRNWLVRQTHGKPVVE